jgi:hypothetical protein
MLYLAGFHSQKHSSRYASSREIDGRLQIPCSCPRLNEREIPMDENPKEGGPCCTKRSFPCRGWVEALVPRTMEVVSVGRRRE